MYVCMVRRTAEAAEATRHKVLDAALEIFDDCGYAGATMERIAERAGVTRGAVYHHFDDKAELHDALLREEADQIMRPLLIDLAAGGAPLERLRSFLKSYCFTLERNARFRAAINLLLFPGATAPAQARSSTRRGYHAWFKAFQTVLEEAGERGELRPGLSPHAASVTVAALVVGLTTTALQAPKLFSVSRAADPLADSLLQGIAR